MNASYEKLEYGPQDPAGPLNEAVKMKNFIYLFAIKCFASLTQTSSPNIQFMVAGKSTMNRFLACGVALAAIMAMSGCVTSSTGVHTSESHVSAISGKRTKIDTAFSEKKDCSLRVIPTLHIIEAPKHGAVEIVHETVVPDVKTYRTLRRFPKCNDVPVTGTVAYYTSAPGFVGSERVLTSHSTGEGARVLHKTIDLNVTK